SPGEPAPRPARSPPESPFRSPTPRPGSRPGRPESPGAQTGQGGRRPSFHTRPSAGRLDTLTSCQSLDAAACGRSRATRQGSDDHGSSGQALLPAYARRLVAESINGIAPDDSVGVG